MRGFSLLELLISVAIVAILAMLGLRSMAGAQQRESLLKTGNQVVDLLRRAQADAKLYGTMRGVCFKKDPVTKRMYMAMYEPVLGSGSTLPSDDDCGDPSEQGKGPMIPFPDDVQFCTKCDSKVNIDKSVFFDKDGMTTQSDGNRSPYEICIMHTKMPAGTRAREVELGVNGDIQLLAQTATGLYDGVVANQGHCL